MGECSNFLTRSDGQQVRVDGSYPFGWLTGTDALGTPPKYDSTPKPPPSQNLMTLRYPINSPGYGRPGIASAHGPNAPLLSAHQGGVNALACDGSVTFAPNTMDLHTLKQWATRDDAGALPAESLTTN